MDTKIVFYLKDNRTVTLTDTDSNTNMEEFEKKIVDALSDDSYCSFSTSRDKLILKPSGVIGVHLQQLKNKKYNANPVDMDLPMDFDDDDDEEVLNQKYPEDVPKYLDSLFKDNESDKEDNDISEMEKKVKTFEKETSKEIIMDDLEDENDFLGNLELEENNNDFKVIEEKQIESTEEVKVKEKKKSNVKINSVNNVVPEKVKSKVVAKESPSIQGVIKTNSRDSINMIIDKSDSIVSDGTPRLESVSDPLEIITDQELKKKLESGIQSGKIKGLKVTPKVK